ncbi:MAG: HNH endonuclease [Kordiimonadaceae bacterium]|nr:HNH endonuclease [Kordiimonadaceae bacterium]
MGVQFTPEIVPSEAALASLETSPALVLNADYRPLSYFPLSLLHWQAALKAIFLEKVHIVSEYDMLVHSPSMSMRLPSVLALKDYVKQPEYPAFTRFNLFLRDKFSCVYCASNADLTFDHVIPRSQGGRTSWGNISAACASCNIKKGGRTPRESSMHPSQWPYQPTHHELNANGRLFPPNYLHKSWRDYLYWDIELES